MEAKQIIFLILKKLVFNNKWKKLVFKKIENQRKQMIR
jgi:hypothetical protein